MSTIEELVQDGVLVEIKVNLGRREFVNRKIYACPKVIKWMRHEVPSLVQMQPEELRPDKQLFVLLKDFITGKAFSVGRQFHRLTPEKEDVFELKTPDLRIFGWFCKKDIFIAVNGCDMERVKTYNLYDGFRDETVRERNMIGLDEPKYIRGATEYDVISF